MTWREKKTKIHFYYHLLIRDFLDTEQHWWHSIDTWRRWVNLNPFGLMFKCGQGCYYTVISSGRTLKLQSPKTTQAKIMLSNSCGVWKVSIFYIARQSHIRKVRNCITTSIEPVDAKSWHSIFIRSAWQHRSNASGQWSSTPEILLFPRMISNFDLFHDIWIYLIILVMLSFRFIR